MAAFQYLIVFLAFVMLTLGQSQRFEVQVLRPSPSQFTRGNTRQFSFKTDSGFQRQTIFIPVQQNIQNIQQQQQQRQQQSQQQGFQQSFQQPQQTTIIPPSRTFQPPPLPQQQQQQFQENFQENIIAPQFEDTSKDFQPTSVAGIVNQQQNQQFTQNTQENFQLLQQVQVQEQQQQQQQIQQQEIQEGISEPCLACICQATTGCNLSTRCVSGGKYCGVFLISFEFWLDGGRQTLLGDNPDRPGAFEDCSQDPICSASTVRAYMKRYRQDCNNDNEVSCEDYGRIHYMGPASCSDRRIFRTNYYQKFSTCLNRINRL